MSMEYIRKTYGVQAKRGGRVRYTPRKNSGDYASTMIEAKPPRLGTITGADGARLRIRLDGDKRAMPYHPTWGIEYLDEAGG